MSVSRFPLSSLLDSASGHLEAHVHQQQAAAANGESLAQPYAGIIFSGNPHETVPRKLLLDSRLTPLERNCWQVFRLLINADGITAFPTYDQLRPYLGMMPGKQASKETVAKALKVLRLTRWLSLGRKVRNELSGQVQGNVYLLHDEPVTPAEALEFDQDYMSLLIHSTENKNKDIKAVAAITWQEFANDPDVGRRLPSHLEKIEERLNQQSWAIDSQIQANKANPATEFGIRTQQNSSMPALSSDAELSKNRAESHALPLGSDTELSGNPPGTPWVRHPNSYSTYTYKQEAVFKKPVQTTRESVPPNWQDQLHGLEVEQKLQAVAALRRIAEELRLPIIEQWQHRCAAGGINNPFGYLMSLVRLASRGQFNATWVPEDAAERPASIPKPPSQLQAPTAYQVFQPPQPRSQSDMQTGIQVLSELKLLIRPRVHKNDVLSGESPS